MLVTTALLLPSGDSAIKRNLYLVLDGSEIMVVKLKLPSALNYTTKQNQRMLIGAAGGISLRSTLHE